jgi:hypothetical protein
MWNRGPEQKRDYDSYDARDDAEKRESRLNAADDTFHLRIRAENGSRPLQQFSAGHSSLLVVIRHACRCFDHHGPFGAQIQEITVLVIVDTTNSGTIIKTTASAPP